MHVIPNSLWPKSNFFKILYFADIQSKVPFRDMFVVNRSNLIEYSKQAHIVPVKNSRKFKVLQKQGGQRFLKH
jgi:hypothetical protein